MILRALAATLLLASSCGTMPALDRSPIAGDAAAADGAANNGAQMSVVAIDVGQGDATLIVSPSGEAALVDAGPPGQGEEAILPLISSLGVAKLDALIVTHYHEDHFGGVPEVIHLLASRGAVYDRGEPVRSPEGSRFSLYESAAAGRRVALHAGERIRLGDADLEVLAVGGLLPDGTQVPLGDPHDENAASVALLLEYSGFRMLIAGDITGGGGTPPYETPDVEGPLAPFVGDIDVLKVSHHGSKTSTNAAFLAGTQPEVAIISVGDGNDHFHPHGQVVERLLDAGAAVYLTERGWLDVSGPEVRGGDIRIDVASDGSYEIR